MYDAAVEKETRPFPKRVLFTGLFDSGKQGKEWPGTFEIAQKEGYFWHAAKSVTDPDSKKLARIDIGLRGERPCDIATRLFFRYKLEGTGQLLVGFSSKSKTTVLQKYVGLERGKWRELDTVVTVEGESLGGVHFVVPAEATLWIDDLLLYEPGKLEKR